MKSILNNLIKWFSGKQGTSFKKPVKLIDIVALGFDTHINESFPELRPNIKINVNGEDIVFLLKKGLNDPDFLEFFECGIKLKAAVKNCKTYGVQKLVFIDETNDTFDDISIAQLEKMDLY